MKRLVLAAAGAVAAAAVGATTIGGIAHASNAGDPGVCHYQVLGDGVNVRARPGTHATILGQKFRGDRVTGPRFHGTCTPDNGWYHVNVRGHNAFMFHSYLG